VSGPHDVPAVPVTLERGRRDRGRRLWKSLDELRDTPEFLARLHREFPERASELDDPQGRREFLRVMGASVTLAGLTGCTRQPDEAIVPYVRQPEELVPGRPLFFATAVLDQGYAKGVLVESHEGRPTKIEGNPEHPSSLGATDLFAQAEILNLYDPDRSQTLTYRGEIRTWDAFIAAMRAILIAQAGGGGAGIRILTETVTSPTLAAQIGGLLAAFPQAKWHQWDAAGRHSARAGALLAFGRPVDVLYRIAEAEVVVTIEGDFVSAGPGNLRLIREHAAGRRLTGGRTEMSRGYAIESTPSLAGAAADHRLRLRASEVEAATRALAAGLGAAGGAAGDGPWSGFVSALVKDLSSRPAGRTAVIPGEYASPAVHALAHAINERLGNVDKTVFRMAPAEARPVDQVASIRELAADMDSGRVVLLLVMGANPVFTAPAELDFARKMDRVAMRAHVGLYDDETAERCHWHVPATHSLESWSDARAEDGTVSILQPLIAPLYPSTKSFHEVLAAFTDRPARSSHDLVRERWMAQGGLGRLRRPRMFAVPGVDLRLQRIARRQQRRILRREAAIEVGYALPEGVRLDAGTGQRFVFQEAHQRRGDLKSGFVDSLGHRAAIPSGLPVVNRRLSSVRNASASSDPQTCAGYVFRGAVDVDADEHGQHAAAPPGFEADLDVCALRVAVGAEQHVPDGKIAEIARMHVPFVVEHVRFRALDQISDPARRADVEMLDDRDGEADHARRGGGLHGHAEREGRERRHARLQRDVERMDDHRRGHVDSLDRVVELVPEQPPEQVGAMLDPVDPVADEGGEDEGGERTENSQPREIEKAPSRHEGKDERRHQRIDGQSHDQRGHADRPPAADRRKGSAVAEGRLSGEAPKENREKRHTDELVQSHVVPP
jgi:MoCo/4Fe-4S cofactor protein with predicted Tat translocation signal